MSVLPDITKFKIQNFYCCFVSAAAVCWFLKVDSSLQGFGWNFLSAPLTSIPCFKRLPERRSEVKKLYKKCDKIKISEKKKEYHVLLDS